MSVELYSGATEYVFWQVTEMREALTESHEVGVYFDTEPNATPEVNEFTTAQLVLPEGDLGDGENTYIAIRVGPEGETSLPSGDHQAWQLIDTDPTTGGEHIIRKQGLVVVL